MERPTTTSEEESKRYKIKFQREHGVTGVIDETKIVEMPQVFLPFAMDVNGQTLYEQVMDGKFLLGSGEE